MSFTIRAALLAGLGLAALTLPVAAAPSVSDSTAPISTSTAAAPLMQVAQRSEERGGDFRSRKKMKKSKMMRSRSMTHSRGVSPRERSAKKKGFASRPGNQ